MKHYLLTDRIESMFCNEIKQILYFFIMKKYRIFRLTSLTLATWRALSYTGSAACVMSFLDKIITAFPATILVPLLNQTLI